MENLSLKDRKFASLYWLYVADSVSMPVHWYYNLENLKKDYGTITGYTKPHDHMENAYVYLNDTESQDIIGNVILHEKKDFWGKDKKSHYHRGLQAGENTLEANLVRMFTRLLSKENEFSADSLRNEYVNFMTTPGSHNDTYAGSCHRTFFGNYAQGKDPKECPSSVPHAVDQIDALTISIPVILKYSEADREVRNQKVVEAIKVIRNIQELVPIAHAYSDMLVSVLHGKNLREAAQECSDILQLGDLKQKIEESNGVDPVAPCPYKSSIPALLFFAYKYADNGEQALLACANAGGENVGRAQVYGPLLGAFHGINGLPQWAREGLYNKNEIESEINQFIQ